MGKLAVPAGLAMVLMLLLPGSAEAAVREKVECSDGVCMSVFRDGTYVRNIVPSVGVPALQKKFGHTETRGPNGFHHNTPDRWYQNVSGTSFSYQASWLGYNFNRTYPKGSLFCTRFWTKIGNRYYSPGDECVKL